MIFNSQDRIATSARQSRRNDKQKNKVTAAQERVLPQGTILRQVAVHEEGDGSEVG